MSRAAKTFFKSSKLAEKTYLQSLLVATTSSLLWASDSYSRLALGIAYKSPTSPDVKYFNNVTRPTTT